MTTRLRAAFVLLLPFLALIWSAQPAWAYKGLATIVGATQGVIKGDFTGKAGPATIALRAMSLEAEIKVDGRREFQPFKLVKEPDRATPALLTAFVTGETLKVEIKWMRPLTGGGDQHYFTVVLEGAKILQFQSSGDVTVAGGVFETLGLSYTKITLRDEINGTSAVAMPQF